MVRSAEREQSEIAVISCQDQFGQPRGCCKRAGIKYQLAVALIYEVCGVVVGAWDLKQQ